MHDNYDLRQEQMNKSSLVSSRKFLGTLLDIFTTHVVSAMNFSSASTWECYEFLPIASWSSCYYVQPLSLISPSTVLFQVSLG